MNLNRRLVVDPARAISRPEQIQPAQMRGSTYAMPAQPQQQQDGFGDLLSALGSFAPDVGAIAQKRRAREEEDQTLAAQREFDGMSLEQARELVATKKINQYESPYFRAAFLARLGQNEAAARKRELVTRFANPQEFDPINGDVEALVDEQTRGDLGRLPANRYVQKAYLAEMEGFAGQLQNKQADAQVAEIAAARKEQTQQSIMNAVSSAQAAFGAVVRDVSAKTLPSVDAITGKPAMRLGRGATAPDFSFDSLASAVMHVESRGNPNAVSPVGARGTMQTMPGTLRDPGFGVKPAKDNSPAELERVGRDYLSAMLERYDGNVAMALAAYNAGPGRLEGWTDKNGKKHVGWLTAIGDPRKGGMSSQEWAARIPYDETRKYVPAVLGRYGGGDGATAPVFMDDAGPLTLPDGSVVESVTQRLADPNAYAAHILEVVEENADTGLATRREQEEVILKMLPALAQQGRDAELTALLDYERGPAGTLRSKLGPNADLLIDTAKSKREATEDETAAGQWEQTQYTLGVKADVGQLSDDDITAAKRIAIDSRVASGRKPLAGGEYFAGLVSRQRSYFERQAEIARREAEKAAEAAARLSRLDQIFASGLGHELTAEEQHEATARAYERNRMTGAKNPVARRALDLKTYQTTNVASPFSQTLLSNGATALRGGIGVGADGKVTTQLQLAMEEYSFYRRQAPNALSQLFPKKQDRELFDAYAALTEDGLMTGQQAMLRVQSIATGEFKGRALTAEQRADIRRNAKDLTARVHPLLARVLAGGRPGDAGAVTVPGSFLDRTLYAQPENPSIIERNIEMGAERLMRAGAAPEAAVKAAIQREGAKWSDIDGVLVNHNGTPIPQLLKRAMGPAIDYIIETKLKGTGYDRPSGLIGWSRSRVMVQAHPNAPGKWLLVDRENLRAPLGVITTSDLMRAAADEANKPSLLERAGQVFDDIMHPSRLVRVRRESAQPTSK